MGLKDTVWLIREAPSSYSRPVPSSYSVYMLDGVADPRCASHDRLVSPTDSY